ncbi:hypothetical protein LR69_00209 [Geobacillus sp. BCO2]|nr:hypothetical protein LR69_00209 [Geobacillus sp. BCO2]
MTVQSPSYYQLERFLEVLEQSERVVAIEGLTVTGPPELTSTNDDVQPLTYSVTVRAFYAPKLEKMETTRTNARCSSTKRQGQPLCCDSTGVLVGRGGR